MNDTPFGSNRYQFLLKRCNIPDSLKQVTVNPFQLIDMSENVDAQHFFCSRVGMEHKTFDVKSHNPGGHMFEQGLKILFLLPAFNFQLLNLFVDFVETLINFADRLVANVSRKRKCRIFILNRFQKIADSIPDFWNLGTTPIITILARVIVFFLARRAYFNLFQKFIFPFKWIKI